MPASDSEAPRNLNQPRLHEAVETALVEDEPCMDDSVSAIQNSDDLLGAGHLRHTTRIDEARNLDSRHTGRDEPANQLSANLGSQDLWLVPQPVARAYTS